MTQRKISKETRAMKGELKDLYVAQEAERQHVLFVLGQQRVDDAIKLYDAGFSNFEIGEILGVCYEQARRIRTQYIGYVPRLDQKEVI